MRWLVALATAWCLLGAGAVRADVRGEQPQAHLVAAHGTGHVGAHLLGAFLVPERVAGVQPPRARVVEETEGGDSVAEVAAPEPVSRGPPLRG